MIPHGVRLEQNKSTLLEARHPHGVRTRRNSRCLFPLRPSGGKPTPKRILTAAKAAGICDETDGAPLREKLEGLAKRKTELLVALCFDDDPVAAGEQAVLREDAEKSRRRSGACGKSLRRGGNADCRRTPGETRKISEHVSRDSNCLPSRREALPGRIFSAEKDFATAAKRRLFWVRQACAALADAVRNGLPQSETVVTVAGDGAAGVRQLPRAHRHAAEYSAERCRSSRRPCAVRRGRLRNDRAERARPDDASHRCHALYPRDEKSAAGPHVSLRSVRALR